MKRSWWALGVGNWALKISMVAGSAICLFSPIGANPASLNSASDHARTSEERAITLLQEMTTAYAQLPGYEQHTEFSSVAIPFLPPSTPFARPLPPTQEPLEEDAPKDVEEALPDGTKPPKKPRLKKTGRTLSLTCVRPNLLRVEMDQPDGSGGGTMKHIWVGDGKILWSEDPEQKFYMREKSPRVLNEFTRLSNFNLTTLEFLMLAGVNPFEKVKQESDEVRYLGSERLRDREMEVVRLKSHDNASDTEVKLYIGKTDRLLYRVVMDSIPVYTPQGIGKVGDPLDELVDRLDAPIVQPSAREMEDNTDLPLLESPAPPPTAAQMGALPLKTRLVYDNKISVRESFPERLFQYKAPENYSFFVPKGATDPLKSKDKQKSKKYRLWKHSRGKFLDLPVPAGK